MCLSACRQRPWPLFCQCASCPTPSDAHSARSGGGQPAAARAVTPVPARGSQHYRPGSRYRIATGTVLSAFPRLTGTIRPHSPKAHVPASHRRQGVENGRRPGCAHVLRLADVAAVVYLHSCAGAWAGQTPTSGKGAFRTAGRKEDTARIPDAARERSRTHRHPPAQPAQLPAHIQRRHRTAKDRNPKPSGLEYAPL